MFGARERDGGHAVQHTLSERERGTGLGALACCECGNGVQCLVLVEGIG